MSNVFGRYGRKRRRKPWRVKDEDAEWSAAALLTEVAERAGMSVEEAARSTAALEAQGLLRREPDGSIVILAPPEND